MNVLGVAALLDAFEDMADAYSSGDGYVMGTNVEYGPKQEFGYHGGAYTPHMRPGIDATKAEMGRLAMQADDMDEFLKLTSLLLEGEVKSRAPVDTGNLRSSYTTQKL